MRTLMKTLAPLALVVSLTLSGCSSSDRDKDDTSPPADTRSSETATEASSSAAPDEQAGKDAIAAYQDLHRAAAYGKDPDKACGLMTEEMGQMQVMLVQESEPGTEVTTCKEAIASLKTDTKGDPGFEEPPADITIVKQEDGLVALDATTEGSEPSVITMEQQDDGNWLLAGWEQQ